MSSLEVVLLTIFEASLSTKVLQRILEETVLVFARDREVWGLIFLTTPPVQCILSTSKAPKSFID